MYTGMATQVHRSQQALQVPEEIDSPRAKLIYLYLAETAEATVDELCSNLRLTRLSVFSILRSLVSDGLVEKNGSVYQLTN